MQITLTQNQISESISSPKLKEGLIKYLTIQQLFNSDPQRRLSDDQSFTKKYNGFYRVRRNQEWRNNYFALLDLVRHQSPSFRSVLQTIHEFDQKRRYDTSFASKLLATINPNMPVVDSEVLRNLAIALPDRKAPDRLDQLCQLHQNLYICYQDYLNTPGGMSIVDEFYQIHPETHGKLTTVKILDLVLWQSRSQS